MRVYTDGEKRSFIMMLDEFFALIDGVIDFATLAETNAIYSVRDCFEKLSVLGHREFTVSRRNTFVMHFECVRSRLGMLVEHFGRLEPEERFRGAPRIPRPPVRARPAPTFQIQENVNYGGVEGSQSV